ncbi:hypothetical protein [Desulfobacula sp.]|uniref:hypothetical protein n=1 Tax=Desulfobacula sp. TaxID=2593537 RepID=UPI00262DFD19|nr:hypothetical protein [Desulfobacula sp.]
MPVDNDNFQVKTPREALSLLSQKMFNKYGKEALLEIEDVWYKLGCAVGKKMKKKLPDTNLITVANSFVDGGHKRGAKVDVLELTENKFHLRGYHCAIGLNGKGKKLCWACMGIDRGLFETATENDLEMKIIKTLSDNDEYCEFVIKRLIKKPGD